MYHTDDTYSSEATSWILSNTHWLGQLLLRSKRYQSTQEWGTMVLDDPFSAILEYSGLWLVFQQRLQKITDNRWKLTKRFNSIRQQKFKKLPGPKLIVILNSYKFESLPETIEFTYTSPPMFDRFKTSP